MLVKGTAVETIPMFIKKKFGEQGFQKWLQSLPPDIRKTFATNILSPLWYPLRETLIEPTVKLCELFYSGKPDGAVEQGRFSAEHALKGVYRLFVRLTSPETLVTKASTIMPTYYQPSCMEVVEKGSNRGVVRMTKFETPHTLVEHRIKGWMERALELTGAKSAKAEIKSSMAKGSQYTDFVVTWL
jgi:hypothetical protein